MKTWNAWVAIWAASLSPTGTAAQDRLVLENERLALGMRGEWMGWDRLDGVTYTADGKYLVAYLPVAHHVYYFDAATLELKRTVLTNSEDKRRWTLRLRDGSLLLNNRSWVFDDDADVGAEWGEDRIRIWDLASEKLLWSVSVDPPVLHRPAARASLSSDGGYVVIATGMSKGRSALELYRVRDKGLMFRHQFDDDYPWRSIYLPQKRVLATVTLQKNLFCWEVGSGKLKSKWSAPDLELPAGSLGNAFVSEISPDSVGIALPTDRFGLWQPLSDQQPTLTKMSSFGRMALAPKARLLLSWSFLSLDGKNRLEFTLRRLDSFEEVARWTVLPGDAKLPSGADRFSPSSAAISPDGARVAWANRRGIHVHDARTGRLIKLIPPPLEVPR